MSFWFNLGNSIVSFSFSLADVISDIFNSLDLMNPAQIQETTTRPIKTIQPNKTMEQLINERYSQIIKGNCDIRNIHMDEYWGVIGFILVFIPGILLLPPFLCGAMRQKDWRWFLIFLFLLPIYPVTLVLLQWLYIVSNFYKAEWLNAISEIANIFVAMEAFFEAFGQLVLQGYTISYGYQKDGDYFKHQQLISIGFSFLALSRVALLYDMVNSFGELNGDKEDHKDDKDGRRFIRRSSIITFIHHSIVLSVILVLSQTNPEFFTEGKRKCIILKPSLENGDPNPNFFWTISVTILIGFQGMMLSLANERKVSDVKKIDLLEEITQVVKSNKARTQNNSTVSQKPQTNLPEPIQYDRQYTSKLPQNAPKPIQYGRQYTPKLPQNTTKQRYVVAKATRGGTLPPGVVHSNVEKWRSRRSENLQKQY